VDDPAAKIARDVMAEHPETHSRLIISGAALTPNRQQHSLRAILPEARYDVLVIAGSDIRTGPDLLRVVAAELAQPGVELVACPFRASAGPSFWTAIEALGRNTEFLTQVLVENSAPGPTLAIRKQALEAIGGFDELDRNAAEDFGIANRVVKAGGKVALSAFLVERRLEPETFRGIFTQKLERCRIARRLRLRMYAARIFTYPIPLALCLMAIEPHAWPAVIATIGIRAWLGWATSQAVLRDALTRDFWYLVPLQDVLSLAAWIGGFFGPRV
jgi:ceramide glucosyltransferase